MIRFVLDASVPPLLMFVAALVGGCYAGLQLILVAMASRWPKVEVEIVGAHLIQSGFDARGLRERVTYRYTVAGRQFVNDRVRIGPQPQRRSIVPATGYPMAGKNVAQRYPIGRRVLV